MNLDFAIIADGATQRPDGKVDIFGGGWDTMWASGLPAVHPQLTLVIRLLSDPAEASEPHTIEILLRSPDGGELAKAEGTIEAAPAEITQESSGSISSTLALTFQQLQFEEWGPHEFIITVDGQQMREPIRLQVEQALPEPELQG
jgi:hypothetical protein